MSIWDVCIKRPIFTAMLISAPIVMGVVSYRRLGVDLFPNVDLPVVTITTTLRGAGVEEMETSVTKPIEEIVNTVSGIDELRSTTKEGVSQVTIQFVLEKNGAVAAQEIDAKVRSILGQLPEGVDSPIIDRFDIDASPVMTIAVSGRRDFREVTEIAKNQIKEDLQRKEDKMKKDSLDLSEREFKLNELRGTLKEKEDRVNELQSVLNKRDSTVNALKTAVTDALLGFQNNGLTVHEKNGLVYVSMEERLLFGSGSTVVEKKGEEALQELGRVLDKNKDINILVEGHTDNVPISGTLPSGARDNWELSVLRATSVVKIILKNATIDPVRLSASGKGPYQPIDATATPDARKKNRRTEIILTPKLDELMKVLNQVNTK